MYYFDYELIWILIDYSLQKYVETDFAMLLLWRTVLHVPKIVVLVLVVCPYTLQFPFDVKHHINVVHYYRSVW